MADRGEAMDGLYDRLAALAPPGGSCLEPFLRGFADSGFQHQAPRGAARGLRNALGTLPGTLLECRSPTKIVTFRGVHGGASSLNAPVGLGSEGFCLLGGAPINYVQSSNRFRVRDDRVLLLQGAVPRLFPGGKVERTILQEGQRAKPRRQVESFVAARAPEFQVVCTDGSHPLAWTTYHAEYSAMFEVRG